MAKKQPTELKKEIQQLVATKKAFIGTKLTLKNLKLAKAKKVYLTSNCPDSTKRGIMHYCSIGKVPYEELQLSSEELGVLCKKPFSISVLSAKNE